jgi:integrase
MSVVSQEGKKGKTYRVVIPTKDPVTGRWRTVSGGTFPSASSARREERRLLRERDLGKMPQGGAMTLEVYLRSEYLPSVSAWSKRKRPLAPTTRSRYEGAASHMISVLGRRKLIDLRPVHVERLRDDLLATGRLAPQTVADVMRVLSQALQKALVKGYVGFNAASPGLVERPGADPRPIPVIGPDLAQRILREVRGVDPWDPAAHLALGATLRREEILGLRWEDVDLNAGSLRVCSTLTWAAGKAHFGPTKSAAGERKIALPEIVVEALRRHRAVQGERLLAIGMRVGEEDLIVDNGIGEPWQPASFSTKWRRFARRAGFPEINLHALRYGSATMLLASGVPDPVALIVMGHADVRMLHHYQKVLPELLSDAAGKMNHMLGG